MAKLIKTFVEGFDERMSGGIPHGHIVLVAGNTGTLKSTFSFNLLYNNVKQQGIKGAYVSLEQRGSELTEQMEKLGMKLSDVKDRLAVVDVGKVRFVTEDYGLKKGWIFIVQDLIREEKARIDFELLVLDSLDVFETMFGGEDPRINLFKFLEFLKGMNLTCILISEMSMDSEEYAKHGIDFLADGIIYVKMEKKGNKRLRRLACVKMRGVKHSTDDMQLLFEDNKLKVADITD